MTKIFISYRRSDDPAAARGINDGVCKHYGKTNVFFDLHGLQAGLNFQEQIHDRVAECDVMLVVIGDNWLQIDESGRSRLENEDDIVRSEISSALQRDIPVIPVLVGNATIPAKDSLPRDLWDLIERQAHEARATSKFYDAQIKSLVKSIAPNRWKLMFFLVAIVVIIGGIAWQPLMQWISIKESQQTEAPSTAQDVKIPDQQATTSISEKAEQPEFVAGQAFKGCDDCPEMVVIPAGSFVMGGSQSDEQPQHRVTVPKFAMGKYEVTFDEYDAYARSTGRNLPIDGDWVRGKRPVINVSWEDAKAYAIWLSTQTGKQYRLPSEAEWEYSARAGTKWKYWWGDDINKKGIVWANCDDCGSTGGDQKTHPVGEFPVNPFGLHDTAGNTWEWVEDCWHGNYSSAERPDDGSAWREADEGACIRRVIRGGSWSVKPQNLRSANRGRGYHTTTADSIGFRLAQDLPD